MGSVDKISFPVDLPFGGIRLVMAVSLKLGLVRRTFPRAKPGAPTNVPLGAMTFICSIHV